LDRLRRRVGRSTYSWNLERLPGWFVAELDAAGVPGRFREGELTPEQGRLLEVLLAMKGLQERGLIDVAYEGGEVRTTVTALGRELAKLMEADKWPGQKRSKRGSS